MYILDGGTQIFGRGGGGGIPCQVQFHGCVKKKFLFQTREYRDFRAGTNWI